ncbi:retrovirus-related pol polyprotein from transposon TNT 1-94 [Tanacetum coccineum]
MVSMTRCLELLHTDLSGPSAVRSYGGNRYTLVIVDYYSRYTWTRFLKDKTEAFNQFEIFSKKNQNQLGCTIVPIRTDHGREFDNEVQFGEFCNANGITHNFSAPSTPQSNGVIERKNRTLQEISYSQNSKAYIILNKHTRKIKESLNVTFDETPPTSKTSPLVDDDLDEEEAIKATEKKNLENDIEDETLEIDKIVNIKEYRNYPLENVIGNLNQRTLRPRTLHPLVDQPVPAHCHPMYTVMSDSDESTVTYTEVSSPFEGLSDIRSPGVVGPEHEGLPWMLDDLYVQVALQAPPSPDYIPGPKEPHSPPLPDFIPEPVYPEYMPHEDEDEPYDDDEDEEVDIEADDEEEEEHPAPADSTAVALPAAGQALSAEETEPFETDESATTPPPHPALRVTARISIPALVPTPVWSDAEVARLLAISTPLSSPLSPWSLPLPPDTISITTTITTLTCVISSTTS